MWEFGELRVLGASGSLNVAILLPTYIRNNHHDGSL